VIQEEPHLFIVFALAFVTVQLGFTNLILAVIVDKANESRERNKEQIKRQRAKAEEEDLNLWKQMMREMDTDDSKSITMQELLEAYKADPKVRETLAMLNIYPQDLELLFNLMDDDDSGALDYDEFVDCFHKAQTTDPRMYMMILQLRMKKLESKFDREFSKRFKDIKDHITSCLSQQPPGDASGSIRPYRTLRTDNFHGRCPPEPLDPPEESPREACNEALGEALEDAPMTDELTEGERMEGAGRQQVLVRSLLPQGSRHHGNGSRFAEGVTWTTTVD